jgi:ABC-2 type transport system permease protein
MNLYLRELKSYWKAMTFWSLGIIFMVGAGIGKYSAFTSSGSMNLSDLLGTMPKAFFAIFGLAGIPVDTFGGFYGMSYAYVDIMGAVFAVMIGSGILAKEERDKTAEFLMVKPITRIRVLAIKLIAALTLVLIFVGVTYSLSVVTIAQVSPNDPINGELALMMLSLLLIMVFYLSISFFLAAYLKEAKKSSQLALLVMLGSYLISVAMGIVDNLEFLRIAVPFQYFRVVDLLELTLDPFYLMVTLVVSVGAIGLSLYFYPKRDLMI